MPLPALMFVSVLPDFQQRTPHTAARAFSRVIWQERYEGIAVVAYRGGKAIAGISGPWSNRYVLTWWQPNPVGQLEIFDTLEAARAAVEARCQSMAPTRSVQIPALRMPRPSWIARLFARPRHKTGASSLDLLRQRSQREPADLSGLSFSAIAD